MKTLKNLIKITTVVVFSSIIALSRNLLFLTICLGLISSVSLLKLGKKRFFSRFKPLLVVIPLIFLFNILLNSQIKAEDRLIISLYSSFKITALSLLIFLFTTLVSTTDIISGLFFLPGNFRLALTMTIALIPVTLEELTTIDRIQQSRGFVKSLWNPIHNLRPLLIPLLHRSFRRAEQLAMTLYSRGYET